MSIALRECIIWGMNRELWVNNLSVELFWDALQKEVDPVLHERWLVERVVQRGRWEDWLLIRTHYDKPRLRKLLPQLRMDARSEHFLLFAILYFLTIIACSL